MDRAAAVGGAGVVVELEPRHVLVEAGALPPHRRAARRLRRLHRRADEHREDVRCGAQRPERRHGDAPRQEGQDVHGAEGQGGEDAAAARADPRDAAVAIVAGREQQHGAERGCREQRREGEEELGVRHGGLRFGGTGDRFGGNDFMCVRPTGSFGVGAAPCALPCQEWPAR